MPKLAAYYYLSQKIQTPSCYFSILCPTLAGAYLAKITLSVLGVNLVLESTYIGYHLTQVAPKSDMSFCSFALGSQPFKLLQHIIVTETESSSFNFDKKTCKSESEGTCAKQLHF